ncbi:patatin-like phospholipase family protein [soil metagenome]
MKINICLSGGGARGFAHLGIIHAIQEMGIGINAISGTSAGSIAGAFVAAGYSPEETKTYFIKQKLFSYLSGAFNTGLLNMDKAAKFYKQYLPATFEELSIELFVGATDLLKGETVIFHSGPLIKPIVGASSIPGLFRPVSFDGKLLLDGGILNNLPLEPLLNLPAPILGIHVNPVAEISAPKTTWGILERTFLLGVLSNSVQRFHRCDLLLEPPKLRDYKVFDYKKGEEIYKIGYDYGISQEKKIRKMILA